MPDPNYNYLKTEELSEALRGPLTTYMGGYTGPSYADQYRNAAAALDKLNSLENVNPEDQRMLTSQLRSWQGNAIAGGALSALNGATMMETAGSALRDTADTTVQDNIINDIAHRGLYGYNSYDQWTHDYGDTIQPDLSFGTLRGMNDWQKAGNVLSSGLSGAQAGFQIGGLWGGIAGGAAGLGYGLYNMVTGDQNARTKQVSKQNALASAEATSLHNREAQGENLRNTDNRLKAINVGANGGRIEKRMLTAKEFADKVLGNKRNNSQHSSGIVRQHCKGGTMVRIKTK